MAGALSLAAGAVAGPWRALGQTASGEADVVIIGAGAAGIAAARKLAEAGRTYLLLEATGRVGGRARTDTALFGVPFDLGAQRLFLPGAAAFADLARGQGFDIPAVPTAARLYIAGREANDVEYEDFVGTARRAQRAIIAAGDSGRDLAAARVLPDLGAFSASAHFVTGPFFCGKDLEEVSTVDYSRAEEREGALTCRQGLGAALTKLAAPLAVTLDTAAREISLRGRLIQVETNRGTVRGQVAIVAVPPSVIAAGKLRFQPGLVQRYGAGLSRITLGAYDHIAFTLPGNPLGLGADELVQFKADGERAYALIARLGGSDVHSLEVGGRLARDLADAPPAAARAFLVEALTREFGAGAARGIGEVHATRWTKEPFALGAMSCALPGAGSFRRALSEVISGRLLLAGEHTHETLWGTLPGAWASGERAAAQALAILAGDATGGRAVR